MDFVSQTHGVRKYYPYWSTGSIVKMVSSEEIRHNFTGPHVLFLEVSLGCNPWWFAQIKVFWLRKHWACSAFRAGQGLYLPCRVNCNFSAQTEQTFMNGRWPYNNSAACELSRIVHFMELSSWDQRWRKMLGMMFVPKQKGTRQSSFSLLHIQLFPVLHPFANQCTSFPAGAGHSSVHTEESTPLYSAAPTCWVTPSRHSKGVGRVEPWQGREDRVWQQIERIISSNSSAFDSLSVFSHH